MYNKEKASYTLGEPFKIYKFNRKRVMVIIIFQF
ncbi:staphopain proregion domain-containing protein [Staphylococcus aureus]